MSGLRGEAAIVGIAELPAEKRQTAPPSFTLDQYARLAKMVIEDAGVDPAVVNGLSTHGIGESTMFAPASRLASALGTQASAKSTSPFASWVCGTMSTPPSRISSSMQWSA